MQYAILVNCVVRVATCQFANLHDWILAVTSCGPWIRSFEADVEHEPQDVILCTRGEYLETENCGTDRKDEDEDANMRCAEEALVLARNIEIGELSN